MMEITDEAVTDKAVTYDARSCARALAVMFAKNEARLGLPSLGGSRDDLMPRIDRILRAALQSQTLEPSEYARLYRLRRLVLNSTPQRNHQPVN
jgi:hypothetical protein